MFVGMCPLRYISEPPLSLSTYVSWQQIVIQLKRIQFNVRIDAIRLSLGGSLG